MKSQLSPMCTGASDCSQDTATPGTWHLAPYRVPGTVLRAELHQARDTRERKLQLKDITKITDNLGTTKKRFNRNLKHLKANIPFQNQPSSQA